MAYYIVVNGSLGSGKSTNAKNLVRILNAKAVTLDKVLSNNKLDFHEGHIASIPLSNFIRAIDIILPVVKKALESGRIVVIDGCFFHQEAIDYLIKNLLFPYYIFTLKVPLEVCIERDKNRSTTIGEAVAREVYGFVCQNNFGIIIDANKSIEETTEELLSYLPKR